ncbi:MAG: hypothetical protein KKF46_03945 [Nanoarchaeota archaeon]|nr:hypothetical protein [Nanoarchaeota archaeon]MBU1321486.1 hypothetical protein [Nanoarchaeota archaeon]MBU1597370.1 hypothetical protein [Nanoarchaeota archaeon]MBU2441217.1 hypothetical protein [Nanoarchaeota archaeon]
MAKILYSLAQDGRGHASRGYEIIRRLAADNHKIMVLTGGDTYEPLEKTLEKIKNVSMHRLPGFQSVYNKKGKINYLKTASKNIPSIVNGDIIIKKLKQTIERYDFDFAISDFEPFLPRAAKKKKLNFITIDNQHRLLWEKIKAKQIPIKHWGSFMVTKGIITSVHPLSKKCIITSVFQPELRKKKYRKTEIIVTGPIIRKEIEELKHKVKKQDFVLVYVKPVLEKAIIPKLKKINQKFIIYVSDPGKYKKTKNIKYKRHSHTGFANDMTACKAVISSAGEQLMSEALFLGKPLFLMPEVGSFEQTFNGRNAKNALVGDYKDITKVKKEDIIKFLKRLDFFENNIKKMKIKNHINKIMKIIYAEMKRD